MHGAVHQVHWYAWRVVSHSVRRAFQAPITLNAIDCLGPNVHRLPLVSSLSNILPQESQVLAASQNQLGAGACRRAKPGSALLAHMKTSEGILQRNHCIRGIYLHRFSQVWLWQMTVPLANSQPRPASQVSI
jgi:hypothetical protein